MEDKILNYYGSVTADGKIKIPKAFENQVAKIFPGMEIEITIERRQKKRSLNSNAFFHGPIIEAATKGFAEHGEILTLVEVKEFFKFRFLRVQKIDDQTGEVLYEYSKQTSKLKPHEMCIFIENCIDFMAQFLGVVLPPTEKEKYSFPEYKQDNETRPEYVSRIESYLEDIYTIEALALYFNQVPDWSKDSEIKALFTNRKNKINGKA